MVFSIVTLSTSDRQKAAIMGLGESGPRLDRYFTPAVSTGLSAEAA